MKDFEYYKKWAVNHLKKQLKDENIVKKSLEFCELLLQKSFPVGTIREWKGKKYKKVAPGKWMRYYNSQSRGSNQALRYAIKQLENINDMETLAKFINANRNRFCDENGNPLPEAQEILRLGKEKSTGIKTTKEKEKFQKLQEEFKEELRTGKRDNTRELQEDVNFWKDLINSGSYKGEHLEHLKEVVRIGEEELAKRKAKEEEKKAKRKANKEKKEKEKTAASTETLSLSDFPPEFLKGKWKKQMTFFLDCLNQQENADPLVKNLYKTIKNKLDKNIPFKLGKPLKKDKFDASLKIRTYSNNGQIVDHEVCIEPEFDDPSKTKKLTSTMLHELMHLIDFSNREDKNRIKSKSETKEFIDVILNVKVTDEELDRIKNQYGEVKEKRKEFADKLNSLNGEMGYLNKEVRSGRIDWGKYHEEYNILSAQYDEIKKEFELYKGETQSLACYVDIYDALKGGTLHDYDRLPGHGVDYYDSKDPKEKEESLGNRTKEIVANVASISIMKPELIKQLEKDQPALMQQVYKFFQAVSE